MNDHNWLIRGRESPRVFFFFSSPPKMSRLFPRHVQSTMICVCVCSQYDLFDRHLHVIDRRTRVLRPWRFLAVFFFFFQLQQVYIGDEIEQKRGNRCKRIRNGVEATQKKKRPTPKLRLAILFFFNLAYPQFTSLVSPPPALNGFVMVSSFLAAAALSLIQHPGNRQSRSITGQTNPVPLSCMYMYTYRSYSREREREREIFFFFFSFAQKSPQVGKFGRG